MLQTNTFRVYFSESFAINKRLDGGIYFIDEFPMNCSGKITRFVVKKMAIEFFNNRHKIRSAAN